MAATANPLVLSPATPSQLLHYTISCHQYPTTLVIGCSKQDFLAILALAVQQELHEENKDANSSHGFGSALLRPPSLFQIAVTKHIRMIFTPSVTHFRAWMATFSAQDSKIPAPPQLRSDSKPPCLITFGLLELHRDAGEWSAQGIATTASMVVETAARNAFRPIIIEPTGAGGHKNLEQILGEQLPLLKGARTNDDGTWKGRTVSMKRILSRWFTFEPREWNF